MTKSGNALTDTVLNNKNLKMCMNNQNLKMCMNKVIATIRSTMRTNTKTYI